VERLCLNGGRFLHREKPAPMKYATRSFKRLEPLSRELAQLRLREGPHMREWFAAPASGRHCRFAAAARLRRALHTIKGTTGGGHLQCNKTRLGDPRPGEPPNNSQDPIETLARSTER